MKNKMKIALISASIAILSACGGGGDAESHAFLSVDNLKYGNGVVCVEDIFIDASSAAGQQVANDLIAFYGTYDTFADPLHRAYSAPTFCAGETENEIPSPGTIVDVSYYNNVIVPSLRPIEATNP